MPKSNIGLWDAQEGPFETDHRPLCAKCMVRMKAFEGKFKCPKCGAVLEE